MSANATDKALGVLDPQWVENPEADDDFFEAQADFLAAIAEHDAGNGPDRWEEITVAFYRMLAAHAKGGGYQCPVVRPTGVTVQ